MYSVLFSHCFNDKDFFLKLRIKVYLNLIAMTSLTQNLAPIHQNAINALASDPYACLGAIVFHTTYVSILKKSLSHFDLWNIFDKCRGRHVCRLDAGSRSKDEEHRDESAGAICQITFFALYVLSLKICLTTFQSLTINLHFNGGERWQFKPPQLLYSMSALLLSA